MKRTAALALGATHAVATMAEATEVAREHSNGQGADSAILCAGTVRPEHLGEGVAAIRKAGYLRRRRPERLR
ncbi:hypothetical protein [Frankia sp. AgKG'84/4]|uniref:hypothetical protein n=1 Tax=Frankia sp. AgKG'84/4 TaxID=573490 RepID=UPI00200D0A4F|nr:hypothetical protein [Frankia sp. AgKG'84/4]MCL9795725.1 hypothetical protein [Frankia sp. AgKG'84/4]